MTEIARLIQACTSICTGAEDVAAYTSNAGSQAYKTRLQSSCMWYRCKASLQPNFTRYGLQLQAVPKRYPRGCSPAEVDLLDPEEVMRHEAMLDAAEADMADEVKALKEQMGLPSEPPPPGHRYTTAVKNVCTTGH